MTRSRMVGIVLCVAQAAACDRILGIHNLTIESVDSGSPGCVPTYMPVEIAIAGANTPPFDVADVNGDGKLDLLLGEETVTTSVLLNTTVHGSATPTFAARAALLPLWVKVADLNGDGKPDFVAHDAVRQTTVVFLNTTQPGASAVSLSQEFTFDGRLNGLDFALVDWDGDGRADIVAWRYTFPGLALSVNLNTMARGATTPSFAPRVDLTAASVQGSYPLLLVDLNGDHLPDLAATSFDGAGPSSSLSVVFNTTAAGMVHVGPEQPVAVSPPMPVFYASGDLDGSGTTDLVVFPAQGGAQVVLLNTTPRGGNALTFEQRALGLPGVLRAVGDLNGDGKVDLVVADSATVRVMSNTTPPGGPPSFEATSTIAFAGVGVAQIIPDVNGDGQPEVVMIAQDPVAGAPHRVVLLMKSLCPATGG